VEPWPPLLLLHGFTGSPQSFQPLLERLPQRRIHTAPALLGHEGRDPGNISTVDSFWQECERIAAVAAALGERCYAVGYSLGARIGLGLLARHADRLCGATLIGVHPGLSDPAARRARADSDEAWCALLEHRGIEVFVDAWQEQPLFESQRALPSETLAAQRIQRLGHHPLGLAHSLRATGLAKMPDLGSVLESEVWGVQLVVGALDAKFASLTARYEHRQPGLRVIHVPGAGHNVLFECPDAAARVVSEGVQIARQRQTSPS
jgi:2-succinyl-6-hydroxy-2,4-cyclohexadiene-1-carboxylate synthase